MIWSARADAMSRIAISSFSVGIASAAISFLMSSSFGSSSENVSIRFPFCCALHGRVEQLFQLVGHVVRVRVDVYTFVDIRQFLHCIEVAIITDGVNRNFKP